MNLRKPLSLALVLLLVLSTAPVAFAAAPTATSFSTSVPANRQSVIQLQGADAEGTALVFATTSAPTHGALSNLNTATGYVVYTPTASYTGADSFTYTVTSGGDVSNTATVTISVSNAKTTVTDFVTDASGQPRQGKVTFILTQPVTTPAGITPAGASVSASLSSSGAFSVQIYPSRTMSPAAYYQVWFADATTLNRELLGVYDIPLSASPVGLSAYKVTDTNLATRYTFASAASLDAHTNAVANATLAQLLGVTRTLGKLQKWDGSNLSDSLLSENGATATINGNLTVTGTTTLSNATLSSPNIFAPVITGGATVTGTLTATNFVGNGEGILNLAGATGSVTNTGATTIASDTDVNGIGKISLQTGGVERMAVEADGTTTIPNLVASGSLAAQIATNPAHWAREVCASPQMIVGVGGETAEMYTPAPIKVPTAYLAFTKGGNRIHLWSSPTAACGSWTYVGVALEGTAGTWDASGVVDPIAQYDAAASTIRIDYKGFNGSTYQIGTATAPVGTPTLFTKMVGPMLSASAVSAALEGGATLTDLSLSDSYKIGSTWHFIGYYQVGGVYKMFRASGSSRTNPVAQAVIYTGGPTNMLYKGAVFQIGKVYMMIFSEGSPIQSSDARDTRRLVTAWSLDGINWNRNNGELLGPDPNVTWINRQAFVGAVLKDPADPNNLKPLEVGGRILLFYSGLSDSVIAQGSVAYLTPSQARTPRETIPVEPGTVTNEFTNRLSLASAATSFYPTADGTDIAIGANFKYLSDGNLANYSPTHQTSGVVFSRTGAISFYRSNSLGAVIRGFGFDETGFSVSGQGAFGAGTAARFSLHNTSTGVRVNQVLTDASVYTFNDGLGNDFFTWDTTTRAFDFFNSTSPVRFNGTGAVKAAGDVAVTDSTKGFVLKSPDGTCYRVTAADGGALSTAAITCP